MCMTARGRRKQVPGILVPETSLPSLSLLTFANDEYLGSWTVLIGQDQPGVSYHEETHGTPETVHSDTGSKLCG